MRVRLGHTRMQTEALLDQVSYIPCLIISDRCVSCATREGITAAGNLGQSWGIERASEAFVQPPRNLSQIPYRRKYHELLPPSSSSSSFNSGKGMSLATGLMYLFSPTLTSTVRTLPSTPEMTWVIRPTGQ